MLTSVRLQNDVSMAYLNVQRKHVKNKNMRFSFYAFQAYHLSSIIIFCFSISISQQLCLLTSGVTKFIGIAMIFCTVWSTLFYTFCSFQIIEVTLQFSYVALYDQCSKTARDCIETSFKQLPRECHKRAIDQQKVQLPQAARKCNFLSK